MSSLADLLLIDAPLHDSESVGKMIIVNSAAINFLEFDADIYDYLDALSDTNIDPYEHLENIQQQIITEIYSR
jgi:hypothetical protein